MAEADCAATTYTVHLGAWANPELAAMVAPPVTVSLAPLTRPANPWRQGQLARSRGNMPIGRHRGPTR
jgi:hypothetical protein